MARVLAFLEDTQCLDRAREVRRVLLENRGAPVLRRRREAEALDQHLRVRLSGRDLTDLLLVDNDVLAHELELFEHGSGECPASCWHMASGSRLECLSKFHYIYKLGLDGSDLGVENDAHARKRCLDALRILVDLVELCTEDSFHACKLRLGGSRLRLELAELGEKLAAELQAHLGVFRERLLDAVNALLRRLRHPVAWRLPCVRALRAAR